MGAMNRKNSTFSRFIKVTGIQQLKKHSTYCSIYTELSKKVFSESYVTKY